ncbi:SDR family oxidoreductase [soil metagenome]
MNVLITGGSKGIGKAIAEQFASNGHNVFLCARNEKDLSAVAQSLKKSGVTVLTFSGDISQKAVAISLSERLKENNFVPDVLVNNAGTFIPGSIYNEPDGVLEQMISVNLYSAYHVSRAVIPSMIKNKSGHIFNICSIASLNAYANGGAYSISKFALAGFSKNLREEMKPFNIKVTAVYPGAVYTASWEGSGVSTDRIMEADDIAKMVFSASFLSPQACVEDIIVRPQLGDL